MQKLQPLTPSFPYESLRSYGFLTGSYYVITMRLVCDNYVIPLTCWSYSNTVTTSIPLRMLTDFSENIAWVFGVNWVFGAFHLPYIPYIPQILSLCFFFPIQIANLHNRFYFILLCGFTLQPNNLITSFYGLPANTLSNILKKSVEIYLVDILRLDSWLSTSLFSATV